MSHEIVSVKRQKLLTKTKPETLGVASIKADVKNPPERSLTANGNSQKRESVTWRTGWLRFPGLRNRKEKVLKNKHSLQEQ